MASESLTRLRNMAKQMPVLDAKAATRASEAQATGLQSAIAQAPVAPQQTLQASQQIAEQYTQAQGQAGLQQQTQAGQQATQIGQMALQEQKFQGSQELQKLERSQGLALGNAARQQALAGQEADIKARKQITTAEIEQAKRLQALGIDQDNRLSALTLKQREDISKLGRNVRQELFDKQLQFGKDERGRKFSNERQLADYAIANAHSEQDLAQKMQIMTQDAEKDLIMMEGVNNRLRQALQQGHNGKNQKLDQASKAKISAAIKRNEQLIADKKAKAANRSLIISGIFMAGGAAAGSFLGPAGTYTGAVAGASIGQSLGTSVAAATE